MSVARVGVLLFFALPLLAGVRVRLDLAYAGCGELTVAASPVAGVAKTVRVKAAGTNEYLLDLPAGLWTIRAESERCASAEQTEQIVASDDERKVSLPVFRAGEFGGVFRVRATDRPSQLHASFYSGSGQFDPGGPTVSRVTCRLDGLAWRCRLPAEQMLTVRLEPDGFAAVHLWDIRVAAEGVSSAAPVALVRGASIAGWVTGANAEPLAGARVMLSPAAPDPRNPESPADRSYTTTTNLHGFFQVSGLPAGDYRVISRAAGLSVATTPPLVVREGESLVWRGEIRHRPLATLDVTLDPPLDPSGSAWTIELSDAEPVDGAAARKRERVSPDGLWSASALRAGSHVLSVRAADGSPVERTYVDLSSGSQMLPLKVTNIALRGRITFGDDPVAADIRFVHRSGRTARATSGEDGRFDVPFPLAGAWTPEVSLARSPSKARVRTAPIAVSADARDEVTIRVPGGRMRGQVFDASGRPIEAAVRLRRHGHLVTQDVTTADGTFDFIGIEEGDYTIEAEGARSATEQPLPVQVLADAETELRIVTSPYHSLAATILTPNGSPASGAVVRISVDGGIWWTKVVTDGRGRLAYDVPSGVDADLIVVTYAHPAAWLRIAATDPAERRERTIRLPDRGGFLLFPKMPTPWLVTQSLVAPLTVFLFAERGASPGARIHLPAGTYAVCPQPRPGAGCRRFDIVPGNDTSIDAADGTESGVAP